MTSLTVIMQQLTVVVHLGKFVLRLRTEELVEETALFLHLGQLQWCQLCLSNTLQRRNGAHVLEAGDVFLKYCKITTLQHIHKTGRTLK